MAAFCVFPTRWLYEFRILPGLAPRYATQRVGIANPRDMSAVGRRKTSMDLSSVPAEVLDKV
jgi:hypothetical protein